MKKIYSLILTALLLSTVGVGNAWGVWIASSGTSHVYFDNTSTQWGTKNVYFSWISSSNSAYVYYAQATSIANTKLYYWAGNTDWSISDVFWFTGNWGASGQSSKGYGDFSSYADDYTDKYNGGYGFSATSCHLVSLSGSSKSWTLSPSYIEGSYNDGYATLNYTQTLAQTYNNGSSYVAPAVSLADIEVSGYEFTDYNVCGAISSPNSFSAGNAYSAAITNDAGFTSTITLTVSNVLSGFTFQGWFVGDADVAASTEESYEYDVTSATTVTARFAPTNYTRSSIVADSWGTLCLPFEATILSEDGDATIVCYEIVGTRTVDATKYVVLEEVSSPLVAGAPYIYHATTAGNLRASFGTSAAVAGSHNGLIGTYVDKTVEANYYVIAGNLICKVAGANVTCGANKAYIDMDVVDDLGAAAPGRNRIEMPMAPENATALNSVEAGKEVVKFFENGQLRIVRDGITYDVIGRVVK